MKIKQIFLGIAILFGNTIKPDFFNDENNRIAFFSSACTSILSLAFYDKTTAPFQYRDLRNKLVTETQIISLPLHIKLRKALLVGIVTFAIVKIALKISKPKDTKPKPNQKPNSNLSPETYLPATQEEADFIQDIASAPPAE